MEETEEEITYPQGQGVIHYTSKTTCCVCGKPYEPTVTWGWRAKKTGQRTVDGVVYRWTGGETVCSYTCQQLTGSGEDGGDNRKTPLDHTQKVIIWQLKQQGVSAANIIQQFHIGMMRFHDIIWEIDQEMEGKEPPAPVEWMDAGRVKPAETSSVSAGGAATVSGATARSPLKTPTGEFSGRYEPTGEGKETGLSPIELAAILRDRKARMKPKEIAEKYGRPLEEIERILAENPPPDKKKKPRKPYEETEKGRLHAERLKAQGEGARAEGEASRAEGEGRVRGDRKAPHRPAGTSSVSAGGAATFHTGEGTKLAEREKSMSRTKLQTVAVQSETGTYVLKIETEEIVFTAEGQTIHLPPKVWAALAEELPEVLRMLAKEG